jgi:uncharacterized protein YbjQ (UPF0145 family)
VNISRDIFAVVSDVVGGRSQASQKVLRDLWSTGLSDLKAEAYRVCADGFIGVTLAYSEFSGAGTQMLFLLRSGTPVKFDAQTTQPSLLPASPA